MNNNKFQTKPCPLKKLLLTIVFTLISLSSSHSHAVMISDLLITEIMANPNAVTDAKGEWFEIYNPSNDVFDFNGITLSDNGSNSHLITSSTNLLINPGEYFVFGKNGNTIENGGYIADYVYSNFTLGNSDDEIILSDTIGNMLSLEYSNGFVDAGKSTELLSDEMLITNYGITSDFNYGDGDYGTPGSQGSYALNTTPVPEPDSIWLILVGCLLLLARNRLIENPRKHRHSWVRNCHSGNVLAGI